MPMSDIQRIDPGPRMSKAVRHGDTIYTMGHVARNRDAAVKAQTIGANAPARTTVGAPLAAPEIRVEMTATAAA